MKGIKLVLLSFISAAMLTSCGMNNTNDNTAPSPESTVNTNHDNAADVAEGVSDAVGGNDANNNGK